MSSTASCIIAAVIILIVIIAFIYHYYTLTKKEQDNLTNGDLKSPSLKNAINAINKDMTCISEASKIFKPSQAPKINLNDASENEIKLIGTVFFMNNLMISVNEIKSKTESTLSHKNAINLYNGFSDSSTMLKLSDEISEMSERIKQAIPNAGEDMQRKLDAASRQLDQVSECFYSLYRSVSMLGSALQLE